MKKIALILITIALLLFSLTSCDEKGKSKYSLTEIEVLKAAKIAQSSKDSIVISIMYHDAIKLPIIRIYEHWYYPSTHEGSEVRYYKFEE